MSTRTGETTGAWGFVRAAIVRGTLLAGLWWVLSDGDGTSWLIGAPVVTMLVAASLLTQRPTPAPWRPGGWLSFLPYFLWASGLGAIDVASRAYKRRMSLQPALIDYHVRLSTEPAQVFFANVVSLLPGTLSAELDQNHLTVHALDAARPVPRDLEILEEKVANLFGQSADLAKRPV
ncbi:MAG: Na+/H+ antiporter subunit E [Pseudomonadota bacterium]